jgi:predicted HNH restriction endonuclease
VYVVATDRGRLLLLGRLKVDRIVDQREADRHFSRPVYEAPDHLIGAGTPLRLDHVVPEQIARRIKRESGKRLAIARDRYQVDANSLRTTGRITPASAAMLDSLLDGPIDVPTEGAGVSEGGRYERRHLAIERSRVLHEHALRIHGTDCAVCGFSFAETYGPLGDGFAEVHHLAPLGSLTKRMLVDPVTDVVVLCANCHRMIHREDPPLTPQALQSRMR